MSETATKADVEKVRKDLRATEKRLDAKIDGVATDVRHVKVDLESVKDDVKKIAEVVVSIDAKLDRHIAKNDAGHARMNKAILADLQKKDAERAPRLD